LVNADPAWSIGNCSCSVRMQEMPNEALLDLISAGPR
jgi:hypothetical protein